jgi:hypothetical protein
MINVPNVPRNFATFDDLMHFAYAPPGGAGGPLGLGTLYTAPAFGSAGAETLGTSLPAGMAETVGSLSGVTQSGITYPDLQVQAGGSGAVTVQAGTVLGGLGTQAALLNVPPLSQLVNPPCDPQACGGPDKLLWCGPFGSAVCKETGLRLLVGTVAVLLLIAAFVGLVLPAAQKAAPVLAKAAA